jgi:molybdopterin/thiamine biosynthesis adenylyltransferase
MGVFAPLTGVIGAMQAMQAIKLVAGVGESLSGRLQVFDAKSAEWRSMKVTKDPRCGVCAAT